MPELLTLLGVSYLTKGACHCVTVEKQYFSYASVAGDGEDQRRAFAQPPVRERETAEYVCRQSAKADAYDLPRRVFLPQHVDIILVGDISPLETSETWMNRTETLL